MPTKNSSKKTEPQIIGHAYKEVKKLVITFAEKKYPVLFVAERGSGKELFAKYYMYHHASNAEKQRTINCAGIAENLLESELFGHVKGSFTGAAKDYPGMLSVCDGGVLFLDEIGDASEHMQASLLRTIEQKEYKKVGDTEVNIANVTIIAATNKPLSVRKDLMDRFHIIYIPALQKLDIPLLTKHILGKPLNEHYCKYLMSFDYPGNVRGLKKACEELTVTGGDKIYAKNDEFKIPTWEFNYERYKKEWGLWQQYVQPYVNKYNLINIQYQYNPMNDDEFYSYTIDELNLFSELENIIRRIAHDEKEENDIQLFSQKMQEIGLLGITSKLLSQIDFFKLNSKHCELDVLYAQKEVDRELCLLNVHNVQPYDLNRLYKINDHQQAIQDFEMNYILFHLNQYDFNKRNTAKSIKIAESTLSKKCKKFNIVN